MYLHLEHRKKDFKKSWKLESSTKLFSVGHSKNADIRLDAKHEGIAGVLEFIEGQWCYTNLNSPLEYPFNRSIVINGPISIPLIEGELHFVPYDKKIKLLSEVPNEKSTTDRDKLWLIWKRNNRIWYTEFIEPHQKINWPNNLIPISLSATHQWQTLENEGLTLNYQLVNSPNIKGLVNGANKVLFDPSLRPYLIGATLSCLLIGMVTFLGKSSKEDLVKNSIHSNLSESTIIQLAKQIKPLVPKNAITKALSQTTIPKTESSLKTTSSRKGLAQVFSQIGKHSIKSLSSGLSPKTITISAATISQANILAAKTFKALGSIGTGSGLHPSQFTKGLQKNGGMDQAINSLGGSNLGQISQGNIGQGDLGLLHKESKVSGGLDREVIAKYIQSQKGKILYCYERQLSANPGLFGKISVKFQIASTGAVESSNIFESTLGNQSVENCLLELISQWKFPKPEGGVQVQVSYPFVFKSLN